MSRVSVTFDAQQFEEACNRLTGPEMKKAIRSTLATSGRILVKEAERQFTVNTKSDKGPGLNTRSFSYRSGGSIERKKARLVTLKVAKKSNVATIHIMANFKAKFFESGTKGRWTKGHRITGRVRLFGKTRNLRTGKRGYRGAIQATHSFRTAQEKSRNAIFDDMDNRMTNVIKRIWAKRI